jgi:two-component sensor histidine kinase
MGVPNPQSGATPVKREISGDRIKTLLRGLRNSGVCILYHDAELAVRLVENPPPGWPTADEILANGDAAIFDAATAARVIETKRNVLETGAPARLEVARKEPARETTWYELHIEADRLPAPMTEDGVSVDGPRGLFVSAVDITELKNREEALRSLLFEVNHRSRNLLAIMQSVLGHTARNSDSVAEFERKFRGRVAALAHSQDLITRSNWQGIRFHRLALNQISEHLGPGVAPPMVVGPDPLIGPNTALHLGLALHELAVNSATFGALGQAKGGVVIRSETTRNGQAMSWDEHLDVPRASAPGRGFGQAILRQIVPQALNGSVELEIAADRIHYRIDWPETVGI